MATNELGCGGCEGCVTKSERPSAEIVFAVRMFMLKNNLRPIDMLKILVALEK
jgi:hypothetical protein